jgi:hypothetical protein
MTSQYNYNLLLDDVNRAISKICVALYQIYLRQRTMLNIILTHYYGIKHVTRAGS